MPPHRWSPTVALRSTAATETAPCTRLAISAITSFGLPSSKSLPPAIADRVLASVAFTSSPEIGRFGEAGQHLVAQARSAFVGGVGDALLLGSVILIAGAIAVFLLAPTRVEEAAA